MPIYTYTGTAYRQALDPNAPWLVSFVATADELMKWAGVPRRSEHNRTGFQRLEDQGRVDKAKDFFQQPMNQSPTSIIVGLHGQATQDDRVSVCFDSSVEDTATTRPCTVSIAYDDTNIENSIAIVRTQLAQRLQPAQPSEAEEAIVETEHDSDLGLPEEGDTDASFQVQPNDDEAEAPEDDELELGASVLTELYNMIDDKDRLEDPEYAKAIIDLAKPATIIDGQHRLLGADATERGIPFSVVAIADCPWTEQVFQFTVVNYTAKGIPDQFITANAALSLTKPELDTLKHRLVQADVKIKEYDLMRVVNFDDRSPFSNLINLSESKNANLIGYKTMVQVANQWFDAKHQVFNTLLPRLYPHIEGRGVITKRREEWRRNDWGEFFLAFWKEVQNTFESESSHIPSHRLWDVGFSQLTVAVVLLELQRAFLDNLNAQDDEFFDVDSTEKLDELTNKVTQRAKKFVKFFPAAFFQRKWAITSLNTGAGREDLSSCIKEMVNSKGSYTFTQDRLFTGG